MTHIKKYLYILLQLCVGTAAQAQTSEEQLRGYYDAAEQDYQVGRLTEAKATLVAHLNDFPVSLLVSAYRLLSLCNLGLDDEKDAEKYVRLLLDENPYYSTTVNDPQRFIDLVESIKSGRVATITTASSQSESLNEVPVPTTLITEEMIQNSGARNLQEVLATYVPGMNIIDCTNDINIAMRGIHSNGQEKILIMLNGHRLNSFATNIAAPDFSMSLDKVRQIEVLRGPASSLYGGVALTAVVNIITRQGAEVDGLEAKAGVGSHGQLKGSLLFGKRYFDLDLLIWGSLYKSSGEDVYVPVEETGMQLIGGDVSVGRIGPKPSYDLGLQLKYKGLQFLYNTTFSQIISPFTMSYTFSPYTFDRYRSMNGIRPSFTTTSHHGNLNYARQLGENLFLKGTVTYDNSDLTQYQVVNEPSVSAFLDVLPIPDVMKSILNDREGISRYLNGQEHTIGGKFEGDWTYVNNDSHKGHISFGAEYNYYQLDDIRFTYGYDFTKLIPESDSIQSIGKGHESNMNTFLQLKHHWKSFILNAGLRFDSKNRFNDSKIRELSPRVALIYVQPKWNVKLSYSKSFIDAPYLYRKINSFLMMFMGLSDLDIDLNPESLHSYQLTFGATQWIPGLNFELNGFYNHANDLIYNTLAAYSNTGKTSMYGLEFSADYRYRRFLANLNVTWQDVNEEEYFGYSFNHAINIPVFTANGVLGWQATKNLKLHTHINFQGKKHAQYMDILKYAEYEGVLASLTEDLVKYEEYTSHPGYDPAEAARMQAEIADLTELAQKVGNEVPVHREMPAIAIVDLGATYKWHNLTLSANINNVFNTRYKLSGMSTGLVPQRGRWFMFEVAYKF